MTCRFAAVYLAVALSSTALATVQPEHVPEAEATALLADGLGGDLARSTPGDSAGGRTSTLRDVKLASGTASSAPPSAWPSGVSAADAALPQRR